MLAHVVSTRTREVGVRMALGASRRDVVHMVLRDGVQPVVSGIIGGLMVGIIARMLLTPLFVRLLPPLDPIVLTVVPATMLAAGIAACYLPARRAAQVDPNVALRQL